MDERSLLRNLRNGPPHEGIYRPGLDISTPGVRSAFGPLRRERSARVATAALILWLGLLALAILAMHLLPASRPELPDTHRFGPYLPTDIPAAIDSGSVQTVLGSLRWAHVLETDGPLPLGPIVPGPSGLLSVKANDMWASADGLHWQSRSLPIDAESTTLTFAGGVYWLSTTGPTSLWRSDDAARWTSVDLDALEPPQPASLDWELILGTPVSRGGVTIFPVTHRVADPGLLLGREPTYRSEWPQEVEPGRYEVLQGTPRGSLTVGDPVVIEETPSGLRVSAEDGSLISVIDGVDFDFIRAWGTRGAIESEEAAVVVAGSIVPVEMPGLRFPDLRATGAPVLLDAPDGFRAYARDGEGRLQEWRSDTGSSWGPMTPTGRSVSSLWTEHGYGHPTRVWVDGSEVSATSDGVTWEAGPGLQFGAGAIAYDSGSDREERPTLSFSIDGSEWTRVSVPGLSKGAPRDLPYETVQSVIGNTMIVTNLRPVGTSPRTELWVLEVTPRTS
jgi:YD repeat-containing protein